MTPSDLKPVLAYLVTEWAKGEAVRTLLALVVVAEGAELGQPVTQLDLTDQLGIRSPPLRTWWRTWWRAVSSSSGLIPRTGAIARCT